MCCWYFADAWLEDPPSPEPTPPKPASEPEKVEYEYISVPCACGCKPPTVVESSTSQPRPKMGDDDYEHWPDNSKLQAVPAAPPPRYDNHNGLHEHTYRPTGEVKKATAPTEPEPPAPIQQVPQYAPMQYPMQYMPYPQNGYGQLPQYMAYPAPAYYGYGGPPLYPQPVAAAPEPARVDEKIDPQAPAKIKKSPKSKPTSPRKWQGRTKAEVEKDDMKIAAAEGAYAERKVQPVGLPDDQVVWVVEVDGGNVLRTFAEVKDLKGEWKADPRFKNSWYFLREAEEKEEEEKKKGGKK